MTMLWAIVSKSGDYQLRYDDPVNDGKAALRGKAVWTLEREPDPLLGETVAYETGEVIFDKSIVESALVNEIKSIAASRILAIAPIWRQINDLANPDDNGASERRAQINAIREWSNNMEIAASNAAKPSDIADIRAALQIL